MTKPRHVTAGLPLAAGRRARALVQRMRFSTSADYWEKRYARGGNSGDGSYGPLAEYKATVLNDFVHARAVSTVLELGCGDGNQLTLADYPRYLGLDVSTDAVHRCIRRFSGDETKSFLAYEPAAFRLQGGWLTADMSMSLDVIFHLTETEAYEQYMELLFTTARRYVAIYSSNTDDNSDVPFPHMRNREFARWVTDHRPEWQLFRHDTNPYRSRNGGVSSISDFYFFERSTVRSTEGHVDV